MASPPEAGSTPTIELLDVTKRFGKLTALQEVSLSIDEGETCGLVGESGSGKTTLGRCVLKLSRIDSGRIVFKGKRIDDLPEPTFRAYRRSVQFVFQNPLASFNPFYKIETSLLENSRLNRGMGKQLRLERIRSEIERVGLPRRVLDVKPTRLSGGQLQRAALARALVTDPDFIVLDEPSSALDISTRGQIITLLMDIQRERGVSYLIISHDLRVVRSIAHRVFVMYLGEIVESGTNEAVFESPKHPYTRALLKASKMEVPEGVLQASDVLHGEVTQADVALPGCKLAPRCAYASDRCHQELQALVDVGTGQMVRCWQATEGGTSSPERPERGRA